MEITDREIRFVANRAKFVKAWPPVGGVLMCLAIGVGVWLFLFKPLLANPFAVLSKLNSDSIPASTLALMAGLLPLSVLVCIALAIAIVLFGFAAFANEKKYIAMIQRLIEPAGTPKRGEPEERGAAQGTPQDDNAAALHSRR